MRDELRTLRQSGMPLTDSRDAVQGDTLLARHCQQEMANLTRWVKQIDAVQFSAAIAALAQARGVLLLGLRNSYPVAMHLRQQLMQVREQVLLAPQPGDAGGRSGGADAAGRGGGGGVPSPAAPDKGSAGAVAKPRGADAVDL